MGHVLVDTKFLPERPISGTVRYMSSENAARKLKLKGYLQKYAREGQQEIEAARPGRAESARR